MSGFLQNIRVSSGDRVAAVQYVPPASNFQIALLTAEVGFVSNKAVHGPDVEIDAQDLSSHLATRFSSQVLTTGQELLFEYQVGTVCVRRMLKQRYRRLFWVLPEAALL